MRHFTKFLLFLGSLALLITSCNSVKKSQKALLSGDYDTAISKSLKYLHNNPSGKKNSDFITVLQRAYKKANQQDLSQISFLLKEKNPNKLEDIFNLYHNLNDRQNRIKPILNSKIKSLFPMRDYSNEIIETKTALSNYLYNKATKTLENGYHIMDFRKAYDDLAYINQINPGYKYVSQKMEEAHFKGTLFVFVKVLNNSDKVIPKRLEHELLDFNAYKINDFWTVYQSKYDKNINYAYEMLLNITTIEVSPEQIREKEIVKEKQIKDGYSYLEDENGNLVKDSLGNAIKVDKFITARCRFMEITQFKSALVGGDVIYNDMNTRQCIQKYPLSSEFVFTHRFATASGDRRALGNSLLDLLEMSRVPFPSNEQMIYDTGADLKNKLTSIIKNQQFNE